jgi:hypothetical protein
MNRKRWVIVTVIVVVAAVLSISLHAMLGNRPPVIASLEAEADRVFPSASAQIVCTASDPDGDELTYAWSATRGAIDGEGATVTWTAPDDEGWYNVGVRVTDGRGGEDTTHMTITVMANRPPEITSLAADAPWVTPSGSLQVSCNASDPNGHELSYEWTASGGNITGTGATANWTGPQETGMYDITVVVDDGHGGSATRTLHVSVVTGQPPVIEALLVTRDRHGHCYLKKRGTLILVGRGQKYDIECIASHPDDFELTYIWEWDGGEVFEISEDGSMVTWMAPNTSVDVTVLVTVSDMAGNTVSDRITLTVVSCSVCTFGHC